MAITGLSARPRRTGLLAIVAGVALLAAACSGGSADSPHVASLGKTSGNGSADGSRNSTTAPPTGNPTQLLDEWAACMRRHGDPNQADPTIGANKVIDVSISPSIQGGVFGYSGEYGPGGPGLHCEQYITAAQIALGGGPGSGPHYSTAQLLKYSKCMRANGIADFPDPSASGLVMKMGGDLNPNNPAFHNAAKVCTKKTGVKSPGVGPPPPGTVELDGGPGFGG